MRGWRNGEGDGECGMWGGVGRWVGDVVGVLIVGATVGDVVGMAVVGLTDGAVDGVDNVGVAVGVDVGVAVGVDVGVGSLRSTTHGACCVLQFWALVFTD